MNCKLLRAVLVKVGESDGIGVQARSEHVTIYSTRSVRIDQKSAGTVFIASLQVDMDFSGDGPITIPKMPRQQLEAELETLARLLAINEQTTHSLASPMPYIGFACEDPATLAQLDARNVQQRAMFARQSAIANLGLISDIDPKELTDRPDGVALLAEALNSTAPLGRYLQLMRLFERAFKLGPGALTKPLTRIRE